MPVLGGYTIFFLATNLVCAEDGGREVKVSEILSTAAMSGSIFLCHVRHTPLVCTGEALNLLFYGIG